MRIIAKRTLKAFWETSAYQDAEDPLKAWFEEASKAVWETPQAIKNQFRSVSFVGNNRVVFNIAGNKYRLIVAIDYIRSILFIKFVGTHQQYNQINVETVTWRSN